MVLIEGKKQLIKGEVFLPLAQYLIGARGTVLNVRTGKALVGYVHSSRNGLYQRIKLNLHGRTVRLFLHRLVAIMHCSPPKGIGIETPGDFDVQVNHIDGNTLNNEANNLEWTTARDNKAHEHFLACAERVGLL